jgi:hypothetical protein
MAVVCALCDRTWAWFLRACVVNDPNVGVESRRATNTLVDGAFLTAAVSIASSCAFEPSVTGPSVEASTPTRWATWVASTATFSLRTCPPHRSLLCVLGHAHLCNRRCESHTRAICVSRCSLLAVGIRLGTVRVLLLYSPSVDTCRALLSPCPGTSVSCTPGLPRLPCCTASFTCTPTGSGPSPSPCARPTRCATRGMLVPWSAATPSGTLLSDIVHGHTTATAVHYDSHLLI